MIQFGIQIMKVRDFYFSLGWKITYLRLFFLFGIITYIIFQFFSGDDEDSANQKRKRILQSQRPVDSDELFSKYALCYKLENSQIFSKKSLVS